jgi:hypothetical protein
MLQEYLASIQSEHAGVISNIFLANNESTAHST